MKVIKQEDSACIWQLNSRSDGRCFGVFLGAFSLLLSIQSGDIRGSHLRTLHCFAVVLFSGSPVHERIREFLPVIALSAVITNAIASDLPLGNDLIGTVFQDQPFGL